MTEPKRFQLFSEMFTNTYGEPCPINAAVMNILRYAYGTCYPITESTAGFYHQLLHDPSVVAEWEKAMYLDAHKLVRAEMRGRMLTTSSQADIQDCLKVIEMLSDGEEQEAGEDFHATMLQEFVDAYSNIMGFPPTEKQAWDYCAKYVNSAAGLVKFRMELTDGLAYGGDQ